MKDLKSLRERFKAEFEEIENSVYVVPSTVEIARQNLTCSSCLAIILKGESYLRIGEPPFNGIEGTVQYLCSNCQRNQGGTT